jgi:hypothetical protein
MGVSFSLYKESLKKIILETVDEVLNGKPFQTTFTFSDEGTQIQTEKFKDPKGNLVQVLFYKKTNNCYELDYTVNGFSTANPDLAYSIVEYSNLLNTVAAAVTQFLNQYEPYGLTIEGLDDTVKVQKYEKHVGQKNRLYNYFISKIEDSSKYGAGKPKGSAENGTIELIKKSK